VEIFDSFVYAATDNGIYQAEANNPNLADYRNWERINNIPQSGRKFSHLMVHAGSLIANYTPDEYSQDAMYRLKGRNGFLIFRAFGISSDAQVSGDYLTIASRAEFFIIDENHTLTGM
jgi:hypothetical protein